MNTLRPLLALLPDPDAPLNGDAFEELDRACDRFEAEWKRVFGSVERPRDPFASDETPDPDAPAQVPRNDEE